MTKGTAASGNSNAGGRAQFAQPADNGGIHQHRKRKQRMDAVEQAQGKVALDPGRAHVQRYVQRAGCSACAEHGKAQRPRPLGDPHQDHASGKGEQRKRNGHHLYPVQRAPECLHRQDTADGGHGQQQAKAGIRQAAGGLECGQGGDISAPIDPGGGIGGKD